MAKPHGILKNPTSGPSPDRQHLNSSSDSLPLHTSGNNSVNHSKAASSSSTLATVCEADKNSEGEDKLSESDGEMVDVAISGDESDYTRGRQEHHHRQGVHFPKDPEEVIRPQPLPYPYIRQDSDAFSSRASSIAPTDEDDSSDYDWSGEEDLVDEEAKYEKKMGKKTQRTGWGPKRYVLRSH